MSRPPEPAAVARFAGVRPAGPREWALLVLLAAIWSLSFVLIKLAVDSLPPANLAAGRLLLAAGILAVFLWLRRQALPLHPSALVHYGFIGLFGNALPFFLIGWGEQTLDAGLAAIFMGLMPLITTVLAHYLIPDEPLSPARLLGVTAGFCGLLVLVGPASLGGLGQDLLAQLSVLGGALCYATTTVYTRRRADLPGPVLATGATAAGALILLPAAWHETPWTELAPTATALWSMIGLGVLSTGLATLIYFHLIRTIGAARFAQINFMIPAFGAVLGASLLDERLAWNAWLGLGLILSGILVVNRSSRAPRGSSR